MPLTIVRRYHDATKHHFHRFARSLGYLDWATQPDPFRRYDGAPIVELWQGRPDRVPYDELYTVASAAAPPVTLERVSALLRYSMGLSAWKQYGRSRWALRVNPSSGNLHPTESYVIARSLDVDAGSCVYHYAPDRHLLERRFEHNGDLLAPFGLNAHDAVIVGVSTIHWREAWKYGERAFRYCQHDTGHAIAAVVLAARMLGWNARLLPEVSMAGIASILGVDVDGRSTPLAPDGPEREEPQCLIAVGRDVGAAVDESAIVCGDRWEGKPNRLSHEHVEWPIIDEVAAATRAPIVRGGGTPVRGGGTPVRGGGTPVRGGGALAPPSRDLDAARIVLQRRSALAFDGHSSIDRDAFIRMLMRASPTEAPPWTAMWWPPRIHLALFVHRVDGLEPGLYFLIRNPASQDLVRNALQREFTWTRVEGVPDSLLLFRLGSGDCRRLAMRLSCDQEIASDGFFSLGMIAEFDRALEEHGAWFYRQLFWETGIIGQVLYLEAEAAGARATGIGCFFDDPVHETLGIFSHALQSLYHFTVGMPVEDTRLTTEPGYTWERT